MSKTVKDNKERQISYPDYTLDGIASKPKFFKKGKEVKAPKKYKRKFKLW